MQLIFIHHCEVRTLWNFILVLNFTNLIYVEKKFIGTVKMVDITTDITLLQDTGTASGSC